MAHGIGSGRCPATACRPCGCPARRCGEQARIGATAASRRAWTPRRVGSLRRGLLPVVLLIVAIRFLGDLAIGRHPQRSLAMRDRAALELENAAFNGLDAELMRVV